MLYEHYPKAVLAQVKKEIKCFNDLAHEAIKASAKGQSDKADRYWAEAKNSLEQLRTYALAKKYEDTCKQITPQEAQSYYDAIMSEEKYRSWMMTNER